MRSERLRTLAALAAALLVGGAVPAAAAVAPERPPLRFGHVAVVPGGPARLQSASFSKYGLSYTLQDVTAVVDTSKLTGVATATLVNHDHCSAAGAVFTCTYDVLQSTEGYAFLLDVGYQAADGAKAGAEGSVSLRVTSREWGTITKTAKVTVADGVSLAADGDRFDRSAKPGGTVTVPLGVRNEGADPITGVDLFFTFEPWFSTVKRYSNCVYGTSAVYCHFAATLRPGTAYRLSEPMGIKLRADIPAPSSVGQVYSWHTPADNRDNIDLVDAQHPKRGTGGVLALRAKPAALRSVPQTDTSGADWQTSFISVKGNQQADLAAVGTRVRGRVGTTVTARVGVRNLGPALVFGYDVPAAQVTVTVPAGTSVVSVPAGCRTGEVGYLCTTTVAPLAVKAAETWPFTLRINRAGTLTGTVTVFSSQPDGRTADNTAKLVVNPPATAGSGGQGAGTGTTGGLPVTGAPVALVSGLGLVLVAGGAAAYLTGRRRRARITSD